MKKSILLIVVFIAFVGTINAQKSDLKGVWKLTESFQYGDQTQTVSSYITFKDNGVFGITSRDNGTWEISELENTLTINCEHFEGIEGENKIETLDEKELKLINYKGEIIILQRISLPKGKELNNKFTGEWLLEKVEKDGKTDFVGQVMDLNSNGIFYAQGMIFGKWDYNKATKKVIFDVTEEEDDELNGEHTILKSNNATLIIDIRGAKVYFLKIDHEKIAKENGVSGLIGTWEFNGVPYSYAKTFVTFNEPDEFTIIEKQEGMESTLNGMWIFNKKEKLLSMIGLRGEDTFKGLNKVVKVNEEILELVNNSNVFKATKKVESPLKAESTIKIEHLTFTYEDFFTEDGEYKYEADKDKLPWLNWREMKKDLLNINQLVYSYEFNDEDNEVFENKILTTNVIANLEYESFTIEHIFRGYETTGNGEARPNTDMGNPLYPLEDRTFRIAGNEQITTPAGTFDCTLIEVSNGYDMKKKLWMINDRIGIYAKIIDENTTEDSGYYHTYELQEIKEKE